MISPASAPAGTSSPAGATPRMNPLLAEIGRMARHMRALTPDQEEAVRLAVSAGASPKDIAAAYGVHVRTIYRVLARSSIVVYEVELGDYRAQFEVGDDGPIQLTEWVAA